MGLSLLGLMGMCSPPCRADSAPRQRFSTSATFAKAMGLFRSGAAAEITDNDSSNVNDDTTETGSGTSDYPRRGRVLTCGNVIRQQPLQLNITLAE